MPNPVTMKADFDEYKKKEKAKWKGRAHSIGARFPIFKDFNDFVDTIKKGKIIMAPTDSYTTNDTIDEIKDMVSQYVFPRDVDRIVQGFKTGAAMPLPIILQGSHGSHRMSGNTRSNVAYVLGLPVKALLINVA